MPYDLIIPDIHEKIDLTDQIIARYPDCRFRYFLGDYWDSFEWEFHPDHWRRVARWLLKISQDPQNVLIAGNHDVHYYNNGAKHYLCSGYISSKHQMIAQEMPSNWLIQHCHWIYPVMHGDQLTLLSHAGLNVVHARFGTEIAVPYIDQINTQISDNFFMDIADPRLQARPDTRRIACILSELQARQTIESGCLPIRSVTGQLARAVRFTLS